MKILTFGEILFDLINGLKHLGGAPLNLSVHLSQLDNEVWLVSGLGDDHDGALAFDKIKKSGIKTDFIQKDKERPTGSVLVSVDEAGQPSYDILKNTAYDFIELDKNKLSSIFKLKFDCFCFGTLVQRSKISQATLFNLLEKVEAKNIFCDLNLRQNFFSIDVISNSLKFTDILKMNEKEALILGKLYYKNLENLEEIANRLQKDFAIKTIVISRGSHGCMAFSGKEFVDIPGKKAKVKSAVGAGDAFSAGFLSEYLKSADLKKSCHIANELGASVVKKSGAF